MEVRQLMNEIDRIQSTTSFNEQNLLDGTFQNKCLQVGAEAGQHIAITIGNMCTNDLIASALSKGIFYYTSNDSNLCLVTDNPHPSDATYPPGVDAVWIPGSGTTWAKHEYWNSNMVAPWKSVSGHPHILSAGDLTIFHSFSYNAITDENVKDKLVTSYNALTGAETVGGTEEDLSDNVPDSRNFQALNAFAKSAIADVSQTRSDLGAVQNRLEHTISNLDNIVENTSAAESSIRDTDIASEMVKYTNNNILAQAGTSMLSQANQSNQSVLSLLQ